MIKIKYYLLAILGILFLFGGCSEDIISGPDGLEDNPGEGRTLSLTATMPREDTQPTGSKEMQSRIALEQDGKNISLTWESEDELQLSFIWAKGDETFKERVSVTITEANISEEGKKASFNIPVPSGIEGEFDLYGVYGGGGIAEDDPLYAVLPTDAGSAVSLESVEDREDVMLYFAEKGLDVSNIQNVGVTFNHLGSLFSITVKYTGSPLSKNLKEARLVSTGDDFGAAGRFNLSEPAFSGTAGTYLSFSTLKSNPEDGDLITFWGWYPPQPGGEQWPELKLQLLDDNDDILTESINSKVRTGLTHAGKVYYFYALWNNDTDNLQFTNDIDGTFSYSIDIPDFTASQVYKVMDGEKQVAQVTKEYLRKTGAGGVLAQAVVVYPVKDDKVELDRGYVAQILKQDTNLDDVSPWNYAVPTGAVHGGQVAFDRESKAISSYTQGSVEAPVTTVYMAGNAAMSNAEIPGSIPATVIPDLIEDIRGENGSEVNTYPIVKIGLQYWMAKNLNTAYYNKGEDNKDEAIRTNNIYVATDNDEFAFCSIYGSHDVNNTSSDALLNRERYGVLYSFLAIGAHASFAGSGLENGDVQEDFLSPDGWIVPARTDLDQLVAYIGQTLRLREFINYDTGEQIFMNTGRERDEGITGFAGRNGSYRNTSGGYAALGNSNGCWAWSRTYNSNKEAHLLHMNSIQSGQAIRRAASIRSIKIDY